MHRFSSFFGHFIVVNVMNDNVQTRTIMFFDSNRTECTKDMLTVCPENQKVDIRFYYLDSIMRRKRILNFPSVTRKTIIYNLQYQN